ncbi:sensor histidine kinase [Sinomicrobium sp. FJxs]|uniref:Sensor histidine kinase n=2 Tax=Sinomicrobium weinanense TaxID=2842200 RepID=A0A926JPT6_9FLAO|nr:sensor histidine kinase [Sinomicrobium weinanense]MBU3125118.1 sensor histidine kinase [Sinomicrobium weinanense]
MIKNDSLAPEVTVPMETDSIYARTHKGEDIMPGPPFMIRRRFLRHGAENVEIQIPPEFNTWKMRFIMSLRAAGVLGMYFVIGAAIKIYMEWKRGEAIRNQVQSEKITSELQFLKAQLNPHFLFNSLNSIYSLSVKKSNDTPEAVITLSDLMRYMLYEANREYVPLARELEYIKNYIKLQRLRLSNGEQVTLNIYGDEKDKKIQPLLFISFIENAFKYGTDYTGKTVVRTVITIKEDSIHFYIKNIIGRHKKDSESSGVGLQNIKNRLELLYPDSHKLDIEDDGEHFTVSLTLKFTGHETAESISFHAG